MSGRQGFLEGLHETLRAEMRAESMKMRPRMSMRLQQAVSGSAAMSPGGEGPRSPLDRAASAAAASASPGAIREDGGEHPERSRRSLGGDGARAVSGEEAARRASHGGPSRLIPPVPPRGEPARAPAYVAPASTALRSPVTLAIWSGPESPVCLVVPASSSQVAVPPVRTIWGVWRPGYEYNAVNLVLDRLVEDIVRRQPRVATLPHCLLLSSVACRLALLDEITWIPLFPDGLLRCFRPHRRMN